MEFEEFLRRLTKSVKDEKVHIMAFISDGKRTCYTYYGNEDIIVGATAIVLAEHPQSIDIIAKAMSLIDSQKMEVTRIENEDQANDYLIDLHLNQ